MTIQDRGVADIFGTLSQADAARLEARLGQVVGWLVECGDPRPRSVLRSVGLDMLADPGTLDRLRARVHAHRTRHQPTTDDAADVASDRPGPEPRLYRVCGPAGVEGDSPSAARRAVPPVVSYDPNAPPGAPGATDSRNGHRPCRYHHRVKTHTGWWLESPAPGTWLWHNPDGHTYLVANGTTTRLH